IASSTWRGFCAVTAESRYASGFPWIFCSKIGKSARSFCASSVDRAVTATWLSYRGTRSMKLRSLSGGFLLTIALVASVGCGSGSSSHSPGAKVFASAGCGNCHTLKAAGAKGQIGPNLDELKPDEPTVAHQVKVGGNGMPSFGKRLSGSQISLVASFVADAS